MAITRSVAAVLVAGVLVAGCGGSAPAEVAASSADVPAAPATASPEPSVTPADEGYWSSARLAALEAGKKAFVRPVAVSTAAVSTPEPAPVAGASPAPAPAPAPVPTPTPTASPSETDPEPAEDRVVSGRILLAAVEQDSSCEAPEVVEPGQVTVFDEAGRVLARADLTEGAPRQVGPQSFVCAYPFEVTLPALELYGVKIGDADPATVSAAELELRDWSLEMIVWQ